MSEDAPNPAAAPPARLIPEGVKCVGCDYDLRGLMVDRVCPECGKPIGETVIVDLDELRNAAWVESVMDKVSAFIGLNLLAAATVLGCMIGSIMLIGAIICVAMLARTLRQGPSRREHRVPRWPETLAWMQLPLVVVGVLASVKMSSLEQAVLTTLISALLLNQMAFFAVQSEATRVMCSCPRFVFPDRIPLGLRVMLLGYMIVEVMLLLLLWSRVDDGLSHPWVAGLMVIGICLSVLFSFICSRAIDKNRERLKKFILASCAYHGAAADDIRRRFVRQVRFSWNGSARKR